MERLHLQFGDLERIAATKVGFTKYRPGPLSDLKMTRTQSVEAILESASGFASSRASISDLKEAEDTFDLDVIDVMGAYIYAPPSGHQSDYGPAKLDRRS